MGINTHYYTVYGVKTDEFISKFDDDFFENDLDKTAKNFSVISDGMGGEYNIIGKVLFDSGDLRWNEFKDSFVEIDMGLLPQYELEVKQEFEKLLPRWKHLVDKKFKLMTFVHYS